MGKKRQKLVVLVPSGRHGDTLLGWLRQLLPAAVLVVSPPSFSMAPPSSDETLVVDAQDVDSPLSLADAIARAQEQLDEGGEHGSGRG